jgi:phage terminase large subunit
VKTVRIKILSVFRELFDEQWRYIIYYGGRSSGKSQSVARALLIRGRQKKLRILCTREIQNTIKDSVHKLLKDIITEFEFTDYVVTNDSVVNSVTGTEFIFRGLRHNITEIKSTEGIDICWVEEAQSITEASLDIITPTIRKPGSQIIFTFNRFNELDPVYVRYVQNPPKNCFVKKVNYTELEKVGLLPDVIKQEIDNDKDNPALFAHKWLGEPIEQSELSILGRTIVLDAMQREIEGDGQEVIGVDVARMGDDRTVFWKRKGLKTTDFKVYTKLRTTQTCDELEKFVNFDKKAEIKVDDTGVGGGVTDEMIKRGYNVVPINFGSKAGDEDKYPNWISEAWFHMAEILPEAQLPYESDLLMELSTRQWNQDNKGKRRVEGKIDYKKRGFRSPDLADACIICYGMSKTPGVLGYYSGIADE